MARIHAINLYPRPNHSAKGDMLRITSGSPGAGTPESPAAFSNAAQRAERKERQRVIEGAPGHLIDSGLPPKPIIGRAGGVAQGRPVQAPPPFQRAQRIPEQLLEKLGNLNPRKGPAR